MKRYRLHRIAVYDKESQLIVGTLTHKDILLFLVQNFPKEMHKIFDRPILEFNNLNIPQKVFSAESRQHVVETFEGILVRRVSSMPIVSDHKTFLGHIHKKDLFYILRNFELEKVNDKLIAHCFTLSLSHRPLHVLSELFLFVLA